MKIKNSIFFVFLLVAFFAYSNKKGDILEESENYIIKIDSFTKHVRTSGGEIKLEIYDSTGASIFGFLAGEFTPNGPGYITTIFIAQQYRKQGHARSLINAFINFCIEKECAYVWGEVWRSNNPATSHKMLISMYKKFGFCLVRNHKLSCSNEENRIDFDDVDELDEQEKFKNINIFFIRLDLD